MPPLEQHMNDEATLVLDIGSLELADSVLGCVDYRKNLWLGILPLMRVVRLLARFLQVDERVAEGADFQRERPHHVLLLTRAAGLPVLEGAVHLMPFPGVGLFVGYYLLLVTTRGLVADGVVPPKACSSRVSHRSKFPQRSRMVSKPISWIAVLPMATLS